MPELDQSEIREYRGVRLSSIQDFPQMAIHGPQSIDLETYRLRLTGAVENPKTYRYTEVLNRFQPHEKVVKLVCGVGWEMTILWQGILASDLITASDPLPTASTVIFHAHDGYTTALPRHYIAEKEIMIAHKMNGITIPAQRGFPLILVAEGKVGYKWIRWLTEIELSDNADYLGYWESQGYSNAAEVEQSKLASTKRASERSRTFDQRFTKPLLYH